MRYDWIVTGIASSRCRVYFWSIGYAIYDELDHGNQFGHYEVSDDGYIRHGYTADFQRTNDLISMTGLQYQKPAVYLPTAQIICDVQPVCNWVTESVKEQAMHIKQGHRLL